ncbi:MAG: IMPACT family protein [Bacillota bacterium]
MEDKYQTISQNYRIQTKIKECKFIASIANVQSDTAAEEFIEETSAEYADATHNVYAFKVGLGDQAVTRANDDGEPAGSSGPPVLQAIEGAGITNAVIVVTRYFGGEKHGIGGLIRAYGGVARDVIQKAGIEERERYLVVEIAVPYDLVGEVINNLESRKSKIEDIGYNNQGAKIIAALKPSLITTLKEEVVDITSGQAEYKEVEESFI